MARKKDSPQKAVLRQMMNSYLKENDVKVKDGTDVTSIILEGALNQEMDEELGYSKYDYRNKDIDNSRNEHSQKNMHTSYGDMEEKIISMYAKGMTTNDIEISDSTISRNTDKILPIVKEWQERSLEDIYAVVFIAVIRYHVRNGRRIVKLERAKFWFSILNGLKNRDVEDILIVWVDGLTGFP